MYVCMCVCVQCCFVSDGTWRIHMYRLQQMPATTNPASPTPHQNTRRIGAPVRHVTSIFGFVFMSYYNDAIKEARGDKLRGALI